MDNRIGEPRVVEAGRGVDWWRGGWRLFASNVGTWIGIVLVYYIISIVLNVIPFLGSIGQALLTPVFMGGIMLGCRSIKRDGTLRVAHLFEGFQGQYFVPLMIVGVVNIGVFVALALLGSVGIFGTLGLASLMTPGLDPMDAVTGTFMAMPGTALLVMLLMLVIVAVFAMLNWFAPALVTLRGAAAWDAMKKSLSACMRNWLPFLVYGLIGMLVVGAFGAIVLAGAFGFLASAFLGGGGGWGSAIGGIVVLGLVCLVAGVIIGPIVFCSTYAGCVDIFDTHDEQLPNPAYQ